MHATSERIILAADGLGVDACRKLVSKIGNRLYAVKIHDLFDYNGQYVVNTLKMCGAKRVWIDFKLHDIPKTVELRAAQIAAAGADILTVHASGGSDMVKAAVASGIKEVYGVTVLTSHSPGEVQRLYGGDVRETFIRLAQEAVRGGAHGIVCSPKELPFLEPLQGWADFSSYPVPKAITPGVRSPGQAVHDQQRVDTPANALRNGASHLVVGRQITEAADPVAALDELAQELAALDSAVAQ